MDTQEVSVTGRRNTFLPSEKTCLQKLIVKYKLHTSTKGQPNISCVRKNAWARITQEYNSIGNNSSRTEAQLRKCWSNIITRRKLAMDKRARVRSGVQQDPASSSENQSIDMDPLMPVKHEEPWVFAHESDGDTDSSSKDIEVSEVPHEVVASPPRESASSVIFNKTDRSQEPKPDFRNQEKEDELHRLQVAERVWLLKTLRERHATAQLEREKAELERQKAQFERDAAQFQRDKVQLELNQAMRERESNTLYDK